MAYIAKVHRNHRPSYSQGFARFASESANPGLWNGLAGAWCPNLGNTGQTVRDVSGRKRHGLPNIALPWVNTEHGLAVDMPGSGSGYVDCLPANPGTFSEFAVCAYARNDQTVFTWKKDFLVHIYDTGVANNWIWLRMQDAGSSVGMVGQVRNNSPYVDSGAVNATSDIDNNWHHYCFQVRDGLARIYVDGIQEASASYSAPSISWVDSFEIFGSSSHGLGANDWNGPIHSVMFWKRSLSDSQILAMARDPLAPFRNRSRIISIPSISDTSPSGISKFLPLLGVG